IRCSLVSAASIARGRRSCFRSVVMVPPSDVISTVGNVTPLTTLGWHLRAVPVEYLGTGPRDDAILAEDIVVQHFQVFDPVWYAREIRVDRDRHHTRRLRAVEVQPIELVLAAAEEFLRWLLLNSGDDDVVDFDRVGDRNDLAGPRLEVDGLIVE